MKITNRRAPFEYDLLDRYEAGIILTGSEVKSARLGHVSLADAYVRILDGEVWLVNANISPYKFAKNEDYQPTRSRKLLLHKKELLRITKQMEGSNLTMVPTAMYPKNRFIKVEVALARGKKQYEKREKKKRQDLDREQRRELRGKLKLT